MICVDQLNASQLSTWYRELVFASEEISSILPIKPATYNKFQEPEKIHVRIQQKEKLLSKYIDNMTTVSNFSNGNSNR